MLLRLIHYYQSSAIIHKLSIAFIVIKNKKKVRYWLYLKILVVMLIHALL